MRFLGLYLVEYMEVGVIGDVHILLYVRCGADVEGRGPRRPWCVRCVYWTEYLAESFAGDVLLQGSYLLFHPQT